MTRERQIDLGCLIAYLLGVFARWRYICVDHDPRNHVVSDMKTYVDFAHRWANPAHVLTPEDVIFPPGAAKVFAFLFDKDPTLELAVRYQLVITSLLPLVILALGWVVFGKATARIALVASSAYFPFIDYGGYFLTEIPMALLMTGTVATFLWAVGRRSPVAALLGALGSGIVCSVAMSFKFVALPAMVVFLILFVAFYRDEQRAWLTRRLKILAAVALLAGTLPLTAAMSYRCTRGNGGRFCLISNKGAADFLMGHCGRVELVRWKLTNTSWQESGSPSAYQHGYRGVHEVPFGISDGDRNSAAAWQWIRENPPQAAVLSFQHVYDLFFGSMPWPSVAHERWWHMSEAFHFVFIAFVLMPVLFLCFALLREEGLAKFLASRELLLLSPILGVVAAVFIATGEPRYRVPFDGFLLIVAIEFYRRYAQRQKPPAPETAKA